MDALVRRHLDAAAEQVDPRPLFDRIMGAAAAAAASRPRERPEQNHTPAAPAAGSPLANTPAAHAAGSPVRPPRPPRSPGRRYLIGYGLGLATAAGIALAVGAFFFAHSEPVAAAPTAEQIVREVREAHRGPVDRCYAVEFRTESDALDESRPVTQARTTRLWTRGDRFWIESTGRFATWAWGRDGHGGTWVVVPEFRKPADARPLPLRKGPFPRVVGLRLDPDETPRWLEQAGDVLSMRLETLLGDVLRDFDLAREADADAAGTLTVTATLKPGRWHPGIRSARLDVDPDTKAIRTLVVARTRGGQPVATVTYTLTETRPLDDGKYQLEGHLPAGAEVYTRDHEPRRRNELLGLALGVMTGPGPSPRPAGDAKKP